MNHPVAKPTEDASIGELITQLSSQTMRLVRIQTLATSTEHVRLGQVVAGQPKRADVGSRDSCQNGYPDWAVARSIDPRMSRHRTVEPIPWPAPC